MGNDRRRRAMALIMVVMVLAILVVIGTPFAVSMLLQEKSGHSFLEDARARYAAEGARNHAVAQLAQGHDFLERSRQARAPWNDPYGDGVAEASADLLDLAGAGMTVADPKGPIWGVDVEDEQGKLNSRTVPARVLSVLDGLIAGSPVPRWHYVTEHSQRPACWVLPQAVRGLSLDQNDLVIAVDERFALRCAPRFRLTKAREQLVGTFAELEELLGRRVREFEPPGSLIEFEAIHPVNPNTAPREVLAAVFTGLYASPLSFEEVEAMLANGQTVPPAEPVTPGEAMALATKMVQREQPFRTPRDFFDFVAAQATSGTLREISAVAIVRNSMNPYDNRLFDPPSLTPLGTAPFCYESQNVWLVEATGVANNPAGNEAGKRVIRDVVEVAPAEKLTWAVESQYDFDRELWRSQGRRVVTWPQRSFAGGDPRVLFLGTDQRLPAAQIGEQPSFDRADDVGHLTLQAPPDRRNPGGIAWSSSWDDRHEGVPIKGEPMTFQPGQVGLGIPNQQLEIDAGGVEFWVKFDGRPSDTFFLDLAQKEWENRLSFKYDGSKGELVVSVCDACADKLASQVRYPISLDRDTWYHLGAVWKSTKYAELALLVDGFPKGTFQIVDDKTVNSVTQLSQPLTESAKSVSVKSTAGYPDTGVIEVGDEAIEYTGKSGSSFTGCIRGARETGSATQGQANPKAHGHRHEHPAGAGVTFFGYANLLATLSLYIPQPLDITINIDRIPVVKGTVREDFGADPRCQVGPQGLLSTDTTIIVTADPNQNPPPAEPTQDFPRAGYLQVGAEVVYYASKQANRFDGCQRAQFGTTAIDFPRGPNQPPVFMWAIPVDDVTGYLDPCIIQIDDEWVLCRPEPNGVDGPYMAGFVASGVGIPIQRGFLGTANAAHATGAKVIPVFVTADPWCGRGDIVTLVEKNQAGAKEQRTVRNARYVYVPPPVNQEYCLAAFDDFQSKEYVDDDVTRLMKFPSGELLSVVTAPVNFGAEAPSVAKGKGAALVGTVDDLRFFASNKGPYWTEQQVLAKDTSLVVSDARQAPGAIKMGDELIGYVGGGGSRPTTLSNAKRGYLRTPVQGHGTGARFINMQFFPISSTTAAISEKDAFVPARTNAFAPDGCVLIDDEVIGYHDLSGGFVGPVDKNGDGVFRGRFGTTPASHDSGSLVYGMPFRYFDFSRAEAFDNQMAYWQGSLRATGAKFLRLRWEEERRRQKAVVRVLARVDGKPNWDEIPSSRPGGLFEFAGPDGRNAFEVSGNELQVQIRFEYERGAFEDDTWKYSPQVTGLWVEYEQPEVVRSHEEE